ncbi:shikimate kinase [Acidianus sulfidivorans JP7]|uniref:Shikimate kinase n=1 Tax=Acidianus sulfidivorans JP7 TaxID=619593 RepID=A0A2U9INQ2_9CREN|nr:shikimate kinase [Acidianus sulfidivorans]AWR97643.1 shikimate kinase [Acidianus sulfidivorans JP7]
MQTYGGISVVNAIPSWYGSSMAINLKVSVEVVKGEYKGDSDLVRTILDFVREKYNINQLDVKISSEIPPQSGLKSSSAVSTALLGEIKRKFDIDFDVPKLSAILSIMAGVSYTGALDDATAAYYGGISFTYNKEFKIIDKRNPPEDLSVLVIPIGNRPKVKLEELRKYRLIFKEIFDLALKKDIITAMKYNGILVAEILGYDKKPLDELSKRTEALAYGISGNGPSLFAVCKKGEEGPLYDILSKYGKVILTSGVSLESDNR